MLKTKSYIQKNYLLISIYLQKNLLRQTTRYISRYQKRKVQDSVEIAADLKRIITISQTKQMLMLQQLRINYLRRNFKEEGTTSFVLTIENQDIGYKTIEARRNSIRKPTRKVEGTNQLEQQKLLKTTTTRNKTTKKKSQKQKQQL